MTMEFHFERNLKKRSLRFMEVLTSVLDLSLARASGWTGFHFPHLFLREISVHTVCPLFYNLFYFIIITQNHYQLSKSISDFPIFGLGYSIPLQLKNWPSD